MARPRTARNQAPATDTPEEETTMIITTESPAEAAVNSIGTENATENDTTDTPKAAASPEDKEAARLEIEAAVTAFGEGPLAQALEQRDKVSGSLTEEVLLTVVEAYRELSAPAKRKARALVESNMRDAMNDEDLQLARANLKVSERLEAVVAARATTSGSGAKVSANPTEALVEHLATLRAAVQVAGSRIPEGVDDNWLELVKARATVLNEAAIAVLDSGNEDAKSDDAAVTAVLKLAAMRKTRGRPAGSISRVSTYSGPRRDVLTHVKEALGSVEPGTFMPIADIVNFKSSEYGEDKPSSGAVSACIFNDSEKGKARLAEAGIEPTEYDGKKGARRSA